MSIQLLNHLSPLPTAWHVQGSDRSNTDASTALSIASVNISLNRQCRLLMLGNAHYVWPTSGSGKTYQLTMYIDTTLVASVSEKHYTVGDTIQISMSGMSAIIPPGNYTVYLKIQNTTDTVTVNLQQPTLSVLMVA